MNSTEGTTTSPQIEQWAAALARGEKVTFHRSRVKNLLLAVLMLPLALIPAAIALTTTFPEAIISWLITLLLLGCAVVFGRRAVSRTPSAVVTEEGITSAKDTAAGPVPWGQITRVTTLGSGASTFVAICITAQEKERRAAEAGPLDFEMEVGEPGQEEPAISLPHGLKADEDELVAWFERERLSRGAA